MSPRDPGEGPGLGEYALQLGTTAAGGLSIGSASGGAAAAAGAGAAGAAGGTTAGATLAFNPLGLILAAGFIAFSILARPNGKDRRTKGTGFHLSDNPSDPNAPIPVAHGAPVWVPPVLARWVEPDGIGSLTPSKGESLNVLLSLGFGPVDGRDLDLYLNDQRLTETVDGDDDSVARILTQVDSARRRFVFPKRNVVESSVVVYRDGAEASISGGKNGGYLFDPLESVVTDSTAKIRSFSGPGSAGTQEIDPSLSAGDLRRGFFLPLDGILARDSLTVRAQKMDGQVRFRSETSSSGKPRKVPVADIHFSNVEGGRQYVWISFAGGALGLKEVTVSYRVKRQILIETAGDGTVYAVFPDTVPDNVEVTATYRTAVLGADAIETTFRNGDESQEALPYGDGIRNTYVVGLGLDQGAVRRYSTANAVHDLIVGIESDERGFYDLAISGGNAGDYRPAARVIQFRVKKTSAPDASASGTDPSRGWITLKEETAGTGTTRIEGAVNGSARWYFSVARMMARTKGIPDRSAFSLDLDKYDVEVVGIDKADADSRGYVLDRIASTVSFGSATEIRRVRLSLPYHATLLARIKDPDTIPDDPVLAVGFAGRMVWVPDADAVLDAATGRPEPGALKWSRNNVWCAVDWITNPVFGAGQFYPWSRIDLARALAAAAWCDAPERNEDGTTETRSELDLAVQDRTVLLDQVATMVAGARVLPGVSGGTWVFTIDRDADPVMAITDDDVRRSTFEWTHSSREEVPNRITAAFTNEEYRHELDSATVPLPGPEPARWIDRRIDLGGTRRRSQVVRAASFILRQLDRQRTSVDVIGAGWRFLALEAGDVVTLTSTVLGLDSALFRVSAVAWGSSLGVALRLTEHVPEVYGTQWIGPNSLVLPGARPPPPVKNHPLQVPKLSVERVAS